jgi:hypothetical protein
MIVYDKRTGSARPPGLLRLARYHAGRQRPADVFKRSESVSAFRRSLLCAGQLIRLLRMNSVKFSALRIRWGF